MMRASATCGTQYIEYDTFVTGAAGHFAYDFRCRFAHAACNSAISFQFRDAFIYDSCSSACSFLDINYAFHYFIFARAEH